MDYIYIGDIVNTHGIKGEVKIISNFKDKSLVFVPQFKLYIGSSYKEEVINSYRVHKNFDMVSFIGINDINEVLKYKGERVYINRNSINVDYFNEDLIGMDVYDSDKFIGNVSDILNNGIYDILVIMNGKCKNLVPNISEFILNIDVSNKKIIINSMEGLINEN